MFFLLNLLGNDSSSALVISNYFDSNTGRLVDLSRLLEDVRNLQTRQTSLGDKLSFMQTENQALWGEIGSLRQKHGRQQQIVSKLMEFLLHFINTNSAHHHETSVEQQPPNEGITSDILHSQQDQTGQHTNNSPLVLSEQGLSPNTLKRKHPIFMSNDLPNKRTTMQQQQQQHPQYGRQQSVTINELTDNDVAGWLHTANASPLVILFHHHQHNKVQKKLIHNNNNNNQMIIDGRRRRLQMINETFHNKIKTSKLLVMEIIQEIYMYLILSCELIIILMEPDQLMEQIKQASKR